MIEKIYKKKTKAKKVIYKKLRLSHTPNIFCACLFNAACFWGIQGKKRCFQTQNECLRRILKLNAMFKYKILCLYRLIINLLKLSLKIRSFLYFAICFAVAYPVHTHPPLFCIHG